MCIVSYLSLDSLLWNSQTKKIAFIKLFQWGLIPNAEKYGRYIEKIKSPKAKYFYKSHLKNRTSTKLTLVVTVLESFGCEQLQV